MNKTFKLSLVLCTASFFFAGCTSTPKVGSAKVPKAYYIAEFDLKNADTFKPYHAGVPKTVSDYGGKYLVRGGETVSLEGSPPKRIVLFEFNSLADAKKWYNSPEYSALRPHRQKSGDTRNFIVESFVDALPD